MTGGGNSRSASLLKHQSCSSGECPSRAADLGLKSATMLPRELDAADTEHVLLQSTMMWDSSSHPGAAPLPLPVVQRAEMSHVAQVSHGTAPAGSWFTRVGPRHAAEAPLLTPFRDVQRASEDGSSTCRSPRHSNTAKRSRSGLSQRLPSLVELPGAEARCAAPDVDLELDCASARDSLDGTLGQIQASVSLPGQAVEPMTEVAAARMAHAGLSQFSSSSPGIGVHAHRAGAEQDAGEVFVPPGMMISTALARLRYAAPALARVRSTVLHAATGRLQVMARPEDYVSPQTKASAIVPHDAVEGTGERVSGEQKQRGGLSVMQLLQHSKDHDRELWRQRLLTRKSSCSGMLQHGSKGGIAANIGAACRPLLIAVSSNAQSVPVLSCGYLQVDGMMICRTWRLKCWREERQAPLRTALHLASSCMRSSSASSCRQTLPCMQT